MRRLTLVLPTIFRVRGGIPRFNQMLCLAVDQLAPSLDLDVTVIAHDDSEADFRCAGAPWHRLRFVAGGGNWRTLGRAVDQCRRERPHLLVVGLLGMTPVGLLSLPFVKGGFGFVAHGFECWPDHPQVDRRGSRHFAARRARFVFAVSRYTANEVTRLTGVPQTAMRLLPNTLEPGFDLSAGETGEAAGLEVLTVSRLWPEERMKGVDHTIAAMARLVPKIPGLRLRIVGKGDDKPRLAALADSLGIGGQVIFEQDLSDAELARRYQRCAVFALPSGQEGFGIVFLEAMRFAKPCIGGDTGGTPEVIEDGVTGLLVPHGDEARLTAALARLLDDPPLRARLGRAGHQRLQQHFVFPRFRERLALHLEELLDVDARGPVR